MAQERTIGLCEGFRLIRRGPRNWELQEWRKTDMTKPGSKAEREGWFGTGNYFQRLDAALAYTYERALREGCPDGGEELADAIARAQQLVKELKSLGGELS